MLPEWFVPREDRPEFWTEERCFITELMNTPKAPEVSLALCRVEPGVTTQLHRLDGVAERYVVRRGRGVVEIDGVAQRLAPGDQALIAAGAAQRITNDGDGDLEFYCVCTPRFEPPSYVNLEETDRHED
ncbi:cupin domain-containing protein [Aquibium sp. A9E412]|uniref:cupin domain-containing protein n=1 Tax=Aquibium sp. A9E412 TaxID=2976767 RepID=UPI0025B0849D|nr:cupin domain-containing protein [Aquibium sp. A9E412]MDN2566669.1 cupin domain-containing protein [Aquibium sp. A9E412]